MVMLPKEKTATVKSFFDGINDIILQIVDIIMLVAPYGVFALLAGLVVDFGGSSELFTALGIYSLSYYWFDIDDNFGLPLAFKVVYKSEVPRLF